VLLYLRQQKNRLVLSGKGRYTPELPPQNIRLTVDEDRGVATIELLGDHNPRGGDESLQQKIAQFLTAEPWLTARALRHSDRCNCSGSRIKETLASMVADGELVTRIAGQSKEYALAVTGAANVD